MKYAQPYGISDPNAPYINGNPSTGTMGSIPPAASIEYPQREIVNMIADSGFSPADNDLHQLARAIQSGRVTAGQDAGTVNQLNVTLSPAPADYYLGFSLRVLILFTNTGPAVLNVNGLGAKPITRTNGGPMVQGDLFKGEVATFVYDGVNFQKMGLGTQPGDVTLTSARDLYVNASIGNDGFDGLTPSTAFKTIDRAMLYIMHTNLNGFTLTVHVADGAYGPCTMQRPLYASGNGYGSITIIGNVGSPQNVLVQSSTSAPAIGCNLDVGSYIVRGFQIQSAGGHGIACLGSASQLQIGAIIFGGCGGSHIHSQGGIAGYLGPGGGFADQIFIAQGAACHVSCDDVGRFNTQGPPLVFTGGASFSNSFVVLGNLSRAAVYYQSITNYGYAGGRKYLVAGNSFLNVSGQGVNYLPGTAAGALVAGGEIA